MGNCPLSFFTNVIAIFIAQYDRCNGLDVTFIRCERLCFTDKLRLSKEGDLTSRKDLTSIKITHFGDRNMKLIYRGTTHERNSYQKKTRRPFQSNRKAETAYNLIYRGLTYRVEPDNPPVKTPITKTSYKLIYRGMTYLVNYNELGEVERTPFIGKATSITLTPGIFSN